MIKTRAASNRFTFHFREISSARTVVLKIGIVEKQIIQYDKARAVGPQPVNINGLYLIAIY